MVPIVEDLGSACFEGVREKIQAQVKDVIVEYNLRQIALDIYHKSESQTEHMNLNRAAIEEYLKTYIVTDITTILTDTNYDKQTLTTKLCLNFHACTDEEKQFVSKLVNQWHDAILKNYRDSMPLSEQINSTCADRRLQNIERALTGQLQPPNEIRPVEPERIAKPMPPDIHQVNIQTFNRHLVYPEKAEHLIDLSAYFDGYMLLSDYDWNRDILFLLKSQSKFFKAGSSYNVTLDTSFTIAFALGYLFPGSSRVNISVTQSLSSGTLDKWHQESPDNGTHDISIIPTANNPDSNDTVLILSISRSIGKDVHYYLAERNIAYNECIECTPDSGPSAHAVRNGNHADKIVEHIIRYLEDALPTNPKRTLHLFCACPNSLVFFLGRASRFLGKIQLYEYNSDYKTYHSTMHFPDYEK